MLKVGVFGSGYVGLIAAVCFASKGHKVVCVDKDPRKVDLLSKSIPTIYENNLKELLEKVVASGNIEFSTELTRAILGQDVIVLALGTPCDANGRADISQLESTSKLIGETLEHDALIINKSTSPPGTAKHLRDIITKNLKSKSVSFDVYSNPEFLREGTAIDDFIHPDRVVIGADNEKFIAIARGLYAPFSHSSEKIVIVDTSSAELSKYASNVFLATKISFMNELALLSEKVGANIHNVFTAMTKDSRIGNKFLNAGCGYGGSCFPKDVEALISIGIDNGLELKIARDCKEINIRQQQACLDKILAHFGGDVKNKRLVVWGVAFKPNTDDARDSVSVNLIKKLIDLGAHISSYDREANISEVLASEIKSGRLSVLAEKYSFDKADALMIPTEWAEFFNPDFSRLAELGIDVIFDFRNILSKNSPIEIVGIGV